MTGHLRWIYCKFSGTNSWIPIFVSCSIVRLSVKVLDLTSPPKLLDGFTSNFQELLLKIPIFASSSVVRLPVKILVRSSPAKLLGGLTYASFKVFCNFFEVFCTCYYLSFFTFFYRNNTGPGREIPPSPLEASLKNNLYH